MLEPVLQAHARRTRVKCGLGALESQRGQTRSVGGALGPWPKPGGAVEGRAPKSRVEWTTVVVIAAKAMVTKAVGASSATPQANVQHRS